jgi:rhodanese-related sulfurtransferase
MHLANSRCHFRDGPDFFNDEPMRQEPLIDQLNGAFIARLGPDGSVVFAANVHELLECDQEPCKARGEIAGSPMEIVSPNRRARFPNLRLGLFITGLIVLGFALLGLRGVDWFLLKKSLRHKFTKVEWISTSELADWLASKRRPAPVLLDVRTPEEWNVSHLPGARRVDPTASVETAAAGLAKETPIVTYCAVGYRSGEMADRLRAAGFNNVRNLEGSIFQWANEHRPLVKGDERVSRVHPFNTFWGRLLNDDVRAEVNK